MAHTYTLQVSCVNHFHERTIRPKILNTLKELRMKEGLDQFESSIEVHCLRIAQDFGLYFKTEKHESSNTTILKFIESELI